MPDIAMDKEFTELAYSALQAKAPYVTPHVVGFQVVSSSEDNSRMIGMFGLNIGSKLYFIPVFFLKGIVKPLALIFDYDGNQFLPFEKEWIDHFMKNDKSSLGMSSRDPIAGFSTYLSPNMDPSSALLTQNNYGIKYACDQSIIPALAKMESGRKQVLGELLPKYLAKAPEVEKKAFLQMLKHEDFANAVNSNVGFALVKQALSAPRAIGTAEQEDTPATSDGGVEFVSVDDRKNRKAIFDAMPMSAREDALAKGYYIRDSRRGDAKATVYNTQYASQFANPTKSGEYSTILEDGSVERVLVLVRPFLFADNQVGRNCFIIRPGDLALSCCSMENEVVVSPVRRSEETVARILARTVSAKAMLPGREYILISPNDLRCSDKFRVKTTRSTTHNTVHYTISCNDAYFTDNGKVNIVVGLGADWFKRVGNEVLVPKNAVALDVTESEQLRLGNLGSLTSLLCHTGLEPCIIVHDGVEYDLGQGQKVDRVAAMRNLVMERGLDEKTASELLKKACDESKISVLIKKANPVPQNTIGMSEMPGALNMALQAPEQVGARYAAPAYSYEDPYKDNGMGYVPELPMLASKLQGEIFDSSVILSLADSDNPSQLVLEYMPDLEAALDKIGRMLFLIWWKYDHFRETFSPADMSTMEADLKTLLTKLGSTVCKMKKRAQLIMAQ